MEEERIRMARKRGSIKPRGQGKFLVRIYAGRDEAGKRKYVSEMVTGTLTDAKQKRTELLYALDTGVLAHDGGTTVKGFMDAWIAAKDLEETSRLSYDSRMRNDVYPYFGGVELGDLKAHALRKHFKGLQGAPRNLSKRTVQFTYMIFKQGLDQAVHDGLIQRNPMEGVDRPSVRKQDKVQEIEAFSKEEMAAFLAYSEEHEKPDRHVLWLFLLTTGLRPSEVFALGWDDLRLDEGTVRVNKALSKVSGGSYEIGGTKTASSERRVPLPSRTVRALEGHSVRLRRRMMAWGWRTELVFPNEAGNLQDIARVRRRFKKACKKAGVPVIRLYDCRHTFATRLLEAKVNPKAAAELMGHSSTKQFLDTYAHVTPQEREGLRDEVEKAVGF